MPMILYLINILSGLFISLFILISWLGGSLVREPFISMVRYLVYPGLVFVYKNRLRRCVSINSTLTGSTYLLPVSKQNHQNYLILTFPSEEPIYDNFLLIYTQEPYTKKSIKLIARLIQIIPFVIRSLVNSD